MERVAWSNDDWIFARKERQRGNDVSAQVGPAKAVLVELRDPRGLEFGLLKKTVARVGRRERFAQRLRWIRRIELILHGHRGHGARIDVNRRHAIDHRVRRQLAGQRWLVGHLRLKRVAAPHRLRWHDG
jgi:hypothetical protein